MCNTMLKAIQIQGCLSGFVIRRCKPRCGQVLPSLTISSKPSFSFLSFTRKTRFRAYYPSLARSASNPDGNSSPLSSFSSPSAAIQSAGIVPKIKFCQSCGGPTKHDIPEGDDKMRAICTSCGKIAYQNPKMVVGCLIEHNNRVLLCKRKIQPSYGLWTLPAGFLEVGESAVEGAIRETREEANADVEVLSTFAQLDIPLIGHTYIIFLAKLKKHHYSPGSESSECQLFPLDDIPFNSLSFSAMAVTLSLYLEDVKAGKPKFHYGTINKRPGSSPSDIHAFTLVHHLQS